MAMEGGDVRVSGGYKLVSPAFLFLTCLFACLLVCPVHVTAAEPDVSLVLFYNQHCSECQKALLLLDNYTLTHPGVTVKKIDIYDNETNRLLFQEYNERYAVPHSPVPALFAGDRALIGFPEIDGGLDGAVSALRAKASGPASLLPSLPSLPQGLNTGMAAVPASVASAEAGVPVIFFYNQHCGECQKALVFMENFTRTHPDVLVKQYDIFDNETNRQLFEEYNARYETPHSYVPAVFLGRRALIGMPEIETGLEGEIIALRANATSARDLLPLFPSGSQGVNASGLTIPVVIAAALVDGINPCAFAVMIFLLLTLMAINSRRKVILTGSVYILAVFLFYFLSGLGLFAIVQFAGVSRILAVVAAFIAIAAGIISLWDAFRKDVSSPLLAIPGSKKGIIERYAAKAGIPAAFILGILVGMFELPCTGGIYIAILALLSTQMALTAGIPLLLLYNVFFIVPLVIILLVVSFGVPVEKLEEWRSGHRMSVRILMGLVMIALGIVMLTTLL